MARHLASARCAAKGHLLAAVTAENGRYIAHLPRVPVERRGEPTGTFTDRRARGGESTVDLTQLDAAESTFATCGCGDDFLIDLLELHRRAINGETAPLICSPVQL